MTEEKMTQTIEYPRSAAHCKKAFIAAAILFVCFLIITFLNAGGKFQVFDESVTAWFVGVRVAGLNTLMEGITYLGQWEAIVVVCLLLLLFKRTWVPYGLPVTAAALVTQLIKMIVKPLVGKERPDSAIALVEEHGYSFPSGHAITTLAVFGLFAILIWYYYRHNVAQSKSKPLSKGRMIFYVVILTIVAFAVGISRVYLGVHFASDVIGGWCAGAAVVCAILGMIFYGESRPDKFVYLRKRMKDAEPAEKKEEEENAEDELWEPRLPRLDR